MWMFEPLDPIPDDADAEAPPMDHEIGGGKPRQYTDETACIVLARAARGDTIDAILATPNMPCRRTLYDWIRDEPRFREAWHEMRDRQALARQAAVEDAELIRMIKAYLAAEAAGRPPRAKAGRKSTYTRAAAEAWCDLIAGGATLREAAARPGMPAVPWSTAGSATTRNSARCTRPPPTTATSSSTATPATWRSPWATAPAAQPTPCWRARRRSGRTCGGEGSETALVGST